MGWAGERDKERAREKGGSGEMMEDRERGGE